MKKRLDKTLLYTIPIIACITIVEIVALKNGINGAGITAYLSSMMLIVGVIAGNKICKGKKDE